MKVIIKDDMVIGQVEGCAEGLVVPDKFAEIPLDELRFIDGEIVLAANFDKFYIDLAGIKHAANLTNNLQLVECDFTDELVLEDGGFRKKTTADGLKTEIEQARNNARESVDLANSAHIEFDGALFQYNESAKKAILETLEEARVLGADDSEHTGWRLLDNTVRKTSVSDLKEIVKIGALRRRTINDQYTTWSQTDMQIPLVLSGYV
jgi:hypothetical protein